MIHSFWYPSAEELPSLKKINSRGSVLWASKQGVLIHPSLFPLVWSLAFLRTKSNKAHMWQPVVIVSHARIPREPMQNPGIPAQTQHNLNPNRSNVKPENPWFVFVLQNQCQHKAAQQNIVRQVGSFWKNNRTYGNPQRSIEGRHFCKFNRTNVKPGESSRTKVSGGTCTMQQKQWQSIKPQQNTCLFPYAFCCLGKLQRQEKDLQQLVRYFLTFFPAWLHLRTHL